MKKRLLVIMLCCLTGFCSVPEAAFASVVEEIGQEQKNENQQTEDQNQYLQYLPAVQEEEEQSYLRKAEEDAGVYQKEGYYLSKESASIIETLDAVGLEANSGDNISEAVEGNFTYQVVDGKANLISYNGEEEELIVPSALGGYPLEGINQGAFRNLGMKSITFSEGLKFMESEGIFGCSDLESVYFPSTFMSGINSNIRGLGGMIIQCDKLSKVTVSEDNPSLCVYDRILYTKDMKTLVFYPPADQREILQIPEGVDTIADDSCRNAYVKKVIMPDTVTYIGYWSFCNCSSLEEINISRNCEAIGQYALNGTQITSLHIPASITLVMSSAICNNEKLQEITVDANNPVYHSHEGVLCTETSVSAYPPAKTAECYEVEFGVTSIDMGAFLGATNLKRIILPNTMKIIEYEAFFSCENLESINLPNGICQMEEYVFANDNKLKNIVLPYCMKEVPENVFLNVTSATVQENVEQIQSQSYFQNLQKIYFVGNLPQNIENIISVEKDRKLTIYYPVGNATWKDTIDKYSNSNITWLPHSHTIDSEWVEDWPSVGCEDGQKSQHCTVCGAVAYAKPIEAAGHIWDKGTVKKNASYKEEGIRLYTCSICQKTKTEPIKMLKLKQPSILSVENGSKGINIKWGKIKGAAGYYIYRKSGKGSWSKIAQVKNASKTTYTDTKAKNGIIYVYTVSAYNGKNRSEYSLKGKSVVSLKAPKISKLKHKSKSSFIIEWTKNSKADGYQIQYSTSPKWKKAENKSVSSKILSKTVNKLLKGKKYYVRIRVVGKSGKAKYYSAWSKVKSVKLK